MSDDQNETKKMESPKTSDDEWEKISADLSSSSSDEEHAKSDPEWCMIKKKKPKLRKQEMQKDEEEEEDDDAYMSSIYDSVEYGREDKITSFMMELLTIYFPELKQKDKEVINLEFIEQNLFPYMHTRALLHLKPASARWNDWISSDFFVHTHARLFRSISGFFYHDKLSDPAFTSLDEELLSLDGKALSFLPENVTVKSSTCGLVVCRGKETMGYYICNPTISEWVQLPVPGTEHGADTAVVIVLKEPLAYNFNAEYFVVCAYEIMEGVYGFETFSSEDWTWKVCNEIIIAEKIIPNSGVSVNGVAHWRTSMQKIVAFDPVLNLWEEMVWGNGANCDADWEIGELDKKLCVVTIRQFAYVEMSIFEDGKWVRKIREEMFDCYYDKLPLSTQGEKEVVLWDVNEKTVVALNTETQTERRPVDFEPPYCADFVPYISTLVHVSGSQKHIGSTCSSVQKLDSKDKGIMSHEQQNGRGKYV